MKLWRTFVRWLARDEISQAYEAGSSLTQAIAIQGAQILAQESFARGECEGRRQMSDDVERAVNERMGGGQDLISAEDIARAKKGIVH